MPLARVFVNEGSFGILDAGEVPIETADWSNDLVARMDRGALVLTGINTGNVSVQVATLEAPAEEHASAAWEQCAQVLLWAPTGQLRIESLVNGPHPDLPLLSTAGPGWYETEIRAYGRELERDGSNLHSIEQYLITIWPAHDAPPPPSTSIEQADDGGQLLRDRLLRGGSGA
ncbi:hypothetical protein [Streptomyces sp. NPDC089799]|uniref:hypothetical protein n=1 Tax=Streptomyces sp. NPDC089799 TaxID=3155066 RepID=UPI00344547CA